MSDATDHHNAAGPEQDGPGGDDLFKIFQQNPLAALFLLLFSLIDDFGLDKLIGGGHTTLTDNINRQYHTDNSRALIEGLGKPASLGKISTGERQRAVNGVLDNAAKTAGISPDLLGGVWGIESRFGTHKTLVSNTGCSGDFQFTKDTFKSMIRKHGDDIAAAAGDRLSPDIKAALRSGKWNMDTKWGSDLRFHPVVATYASAFYLREVAGTLKVDPKTQNNFGLIFAGYNVGPGNADHLRDLHEQGSGVTAVRAIGKPARQNPLFYKGGATATEAISRYQSYVETRIADYHKSFGASAPAPVVASANASRTTSAAKGEQPPVLKATFDPAAVSVTPDAPAQQPTPAAKPDEKPQPLLPA